MDAEFAEGRERPSTLAFADLTGGDARYAFFDEGSAGRMLTEDDLPAFPKTVTALHFGSLSLAEEPCGSALESLMQRDHQDCVISLDPNIRPSLIKNRDGYVARLNRMAVMSDIIRLSEDDLAWLAPDVPIADIAKGWFDHGTKVVILTKGAGGAEALTRSRLSVTTAAVAAEVVDTIGAGDAFTAAVLARLDQKRLLTKPGIAGLDKATLADVLAFAAKAAAITVSRAGADPPWLNEMSSSP